VFYKEEQVKRKLFKTALLMLLVAVLTVIPVSVFADSAETPVLTSGAYTYVASTRNEATITSVNAAVGTTVTVPEKLG
jgi:hypothetical protein